MGHEMSYPLGSEIKKKTRALLQIAVKAAMGVTFRIQEHIHRFSHLLCVSLSTDIANSY